MAIIFAMNIAINISIKNKMPYASEVFFHVIFIGKLHERSYKLCFKKQQILRLAG